MTRLLALTWLAFVAAISLVPLRFKYRVGTTGVFHIPGHFFAFFIAALLLCGTPLNPNHRLLRWAGVCLFAFIIETLESLLYHNSLEWRDVLVDTLGAAVGLVVISLWSRRFSAAKTSAANPDAHV